jgi:NAD(P)H-dependent FMN reductase
MLKLGIVTGSTRPGRNNEAVANWVYSVAKEREDAEFELVDIASYHLPLLDEPMPPVFSQYSHEHTKAWSDKIASFDAYVLVTPEYNHSFPAPLKEAVDAHYTQWQAKPVGFVSYGGIGGGLRAVEQLRLVFAELHAMTVRDSVSFHGAWSCFDEDGAPHDPTVVEGAAKGMLDQLEWWGRALRTAREAVPYGQG